MSPVVASSDDCAVDVKAEFKVVVKRASIGAKDFTIDGLALRPRVGDSGRYIVIVRLQTPTISLYSDLPMKISFLSMKREIGRR